jgi:hypothetical protein
MSRKIRHLLATAGLVVFAVIVSILFFDVITRQFVKPSRAAFGELFGSELPPLRVVFPVDAHEVQDPTAPYRGMTVDGKQITLGDLWGHLRLDPLLGYTYEENVTSKNGWWQSNNVGARTRANVSAERPGSRTRVLVFGESFAHGSRLQQEDAYPSVIGEQHPEFEVLNFAVDGYSMAQSFLHYRQIRKRLKYDVVILTFVPETDAWRDINVLRQLAYPGWGMTLMPRFIMSHGDLSLVRPLYSDPFELFQKNREGFSTELRDYLRDYDRFYFPDMYEEPQLLGKMIFWKLIARARWLDWRRKLDLGLLDPNGEALNVSDAIFDTMQKEVQADGAAFILAILPYQHRWWNGEAKEAERMEWDRMVSFVCAQQASCLDLLPELLTVPSEEIDRAPDNEHFGPKMNIRIATVIHDALRRARP